MALTSEEHTSAHKGPSNPLQHIFGKWSGKTILELLSWPPGKNNFSIFIGQFWVNFERPKIAPRSRDQNFNRIS